MCIFCISANVLWRTQLERCVICISVKQSSMAVICMRLIRHVTEALCSQVIIKILCGGLPGALHKSTFETRCLVKKSHGCDKKKKRCSPKHAKFGVYCTLSFLSIKSPSPHSLFHYIEKSSQYILKNHLFVKPAQKKESHAGLNWHMHLHLRIKQKLLSKTTYTAFRLYM